MIMKQLGETQKELNQLKKEYEKATNHARNYNADSVRQYFSNLRWYRLPPPKPTENCYK